MNIRISILLTLLAAILVFFAGYHVWKIFRIGSAYKAKLLCSSVFISGRNPEQVLKQDLSGPERIIFTRIDYQKQSVTAWLPGIPKQKAVFVSHLGCTLLAGMDEDTFRQRAAHWINNDTLQGINNSLALSFEFTKQPDPDQQKIRNAIENEFSRSDSERSGTARAVVVLKNGRIIAERYSPGFSESMPLLGWSMAKSVFNALTGIAVRQGKLSPKQPAPVKEWSDSSDPRSQITLDQLLRMSSGLKFNETAGAVVSDVNRMLFLYPAAAAYASEKPLANSPDTDWNYSSGTTNIISKILLEVAGGNTAKFIAFVHDELFNPLGIKQAVIEPDASGNLIGSSFMYATAREWATFGQLYLQDGLWNDQRILPEGWVEYSSATTPTSDMNEYGAHFWTNGGLSTPVDQRPFPNLPRDLFYASGYKGQRLVVIPSLQMVILRMGWGGNYTMVPLIAEIVAAQSQ